MPDPFRKWAQGDEFSPSAAQLNAWTDAARLAQQAIGHQSPVAPIGSQLFVPLRMRNNTGVKIPQLGVVTYETPMITPATNEERFVFDLIVNAIKPQAPFDRFAIATRQVAVGEVFEAAIGGVIPCKVTGTGAKVLAINNDADKLQAGTTGLDLVWSEAGSGVRFGLVKLFGAGSDCARTWWLSGEGAPSGGTITFAVRVNGVTEDVVFPCPCTIAQTIAALELHSQIDTDDVTVTGGTLPNVAQKIVFKNNPSNITAIANALTASWAAVPGYYWEPC